MNEREGVGGTRRSELALDGFHRVLEDAWRRVQKEWEGRLLLHESDVQASVYHHLRETHPMERTGFQIWSELKWNPGGRQRRPDLAVQLSGPDRWIVLEFKWLFGGNVRWARADLSEKLKLDRDEAEPPLRAYFLFVSEARDRTDADRIRQELHDLAKWAEGEHYLFLAEGFFLDPGGGKPRPACQPWAIREI